MYQSASCVTVGCVCGSGCIYTYMFCLHSSLLLHALHSCAEDTQTPPSETQLTLSQKVTGECAYSCISKEIECGCEDSFLLRRSSMLSHALPKSREQKSCRQREGSSWGGGTGRTHNSSVLHCPSPEWRSSTGRADQMVRRERLAASHMASACSRYGLCGDCKTGHSGSQERPRPVKVCAQRI